MCNVTPEFFHEIVGISAIPVTASYYFNFVCFIFFFGTCLLSLQKDFQDQFLKMSKRQIFNFGTNLFLVSIIQNYILY